MFFTFTGADAMCAGAAAVLDIIEREHLVERSRGDGRRARRHASTTPSATIPPSSTSAAAACSAASSCDRAAARWPPPSWRECLARDLWIYPAGSGVPPVTDAVMIGAPFTISEAEVDELVERLAAAIDAATAHA